MYRIALVEKDMSKHELIKLYNILSIRLKMYQGKKTKIRYIIIVILKKIEK